MIARVYNHHYTKYALLTVLLMAVIFPFPAHALFEETMYAFVVTVFGFFVQLAGMLLDFGFEQLVVNMGSHLVSGQGGTGIGTAVDLLWTTVRDIFNILFIFGLIYIGFKTILFSDDANVKRLVGYLIMAALLINFSLFITKAIVDVSNLTATQVYKAITVNAGNVSSDDIVGYQIFDSGPRTGISFVLMSKVQLQSLFDADDALPKLPGAHQYTYIIGIMVLFVIATITFAAGGFMLIARFVTLIFLMILSPVMFLGWILPYFGSYSSKYWDMFLKQAFFAPAYAFTLYMSLKVLEIMGSAFGLKGASYASALKSGDNADIAVIIFFLVAMAFLIASVIVAQKMGIAGADTTMGVLKGTGNYVRGRAQNVAGGATFGLAARAGRNTVGFGAQKLADSDKLQKFAAKSFVGKGILNATRGVAGSSFDGRQVAGIGKNMGIGEGKKGGYTKILKEDAEADKKFAESLGEVKDEALLAQIEEMKEQYKNAEKGSPEKRRLGIELDKLEEREYKVRYAKQLDYIKQLEGTSEFWKKWMPVPSTLAAGTGVGLAPSVVGASLGATAATLTVAPAALAAGISTQAMSYKNQNSAKTLQKEWGIDGIKEKKRKKRIREVIDEAATSAGGDEAEAA